MSKNERLKKKENIKNENSKTIEVNTQKRDPLPIIHRNKNLRSLIIRKMEEDEKCKQYIQTEVNDYFNSPDRYFDKNSPISINQEIIIKDINLFQKEPLGNLTQKKSNKNLSFTPIRKKTSHPVLLQTSGNTTNNININNIREELPRYEIIDNEKLKSIFESFQDSNNHNSFLNDNTKKFPSDLSKSLSVQNNRLKSSRNDMRNRQQMSGFLSKRLNKNEKDLLINNIDSYIYKRELMNNIQSKDFVELYPRYYWKMNLRRDNYTKRKDLSVNIKNIYNPFFSFIVDNPQHKKEMLFKSGIDLNSKQLKDLKKNKYLINNYSKKIQNLTVNGKKLFNVEFDREMSSKKRKILHRVFIENGREILDTDINNVYGEETIYKNYNQDKVRYEKGNKNISYISRNNTNI